MIPKNKYYKHRKIF